MKPLPPARDPIEALGQAYELLLEKAMHETRSIKENTGPALHKLIDSSSQTLSDFIEISEEEALKVSEYLKRDLHDAAEFIAETGEDFKNWIAVDVDVKENYFLELFKQAADQTTIELLALKKQAEMADYRSGEITGPGVLVCDACGEQIHFIQAGHIPPCPKCNHAQFHRIHCKE